MLFNLPVLLGVAVLSESLMAAPIYNSADRTPTKNEFALKTDAKSGAKSKRPALRIDTDGLPYKWNAELGIHSPSIHHQPPKTHQKEITDSPMDELSPLYRPQALDLETSTTWLQPALEKFKSGEGRATHNMAK